MSQKIHIMVVMIGLLYLVTHCLEADVMHTTTVFEM